MRTNALKFNNEKPAYYDIPESELSDECLKLKDFKLLDVNESEEIEMDSLIEPYVSESYVSF